MPTQVLKYFQVTLEQWDIPMVLEHLCMERSEVDPELGIKLTACVGHLVPVMEQLHCLFQTNGYQQPNNDGGNMDEEVFPTADRLMECVNIEHGC